MTSPVGEEDSSTLPPRTGSDATGAPAGAEVAGLALLWSRDSPGRGGEGLLLPAGFSGPWTFGRGEGRGEDRRLGLARQSPGALVATGPLECPRISRAQIRLSQAEGSGILVENLGSCALVHQGREVASAEVAP